MDRVSEVLLTMLSIEVLQLLITGVSVEKVSELILVTLRYSRYKQARVPDAAVDCHARRPADYDGATRPLGGIVLLLPPGGSGSREPFAAADREAHQLRVCATATEGQLQ